MAKLVSNWYKEAQSSLPEKYILPLEKRPGDPAAIPSCESIPVIDLDEGGNFGNYRVAKGKEIVKAGYDFGFFQVINHGVSTELMVDAMQVCNAFFNMSAEVKGKFYSEDGRTSEYGVYTSSLRYPNEDVHLWRDTLRHPCHPLKDCIQFWPDEPQNYREVMGRYAVEVKALSSRILDLICEGLGLDGGYLGGELSENHALLIHNYPPCPDPSSTLGLINHFDPTLITLVQQQGDVSGLQVLKDNNWLGVDPIPYAFVINIGSQLQVISNDKVRSIEHRAVTNSKRSRTSIVSFINPSKESIIEPAEILIDECNPPLYNSFLFKDFFNTFLIKAAKSQSTLDNFKIQN